VTRVLEHEPAGWAARAVCRPGSGVDPETFWPLSAGGRGDHDTTTDLDQAADAIAICRQCPVQSDCLEFAIEHGEFRGIWGGMTPHQRAWHARHHRRAAPEPGPVPQLGPLVESSRFRALRKLRDAGQPAESIAAYFGVRVRTIEGWLRQMRTADRMRRELQGAGR
jgi:WhiB family redox-sensing transcriptional regulator